MSAVRSRLDHRLMRAGSRLWRGRRVDGMEPLRGGVTEVPRAELGKNSLQEFARFAVDENNKKTNALLSYERLVKAKTQLVSGRMYYLTIEVKDGTAKKLYEAKVWEKPWMKFKGLDEFKPAENPWKNFRGLFV